MGIYEILLILAIALILFGPEDLPDIARKIGKVVFEIRKATSELTREFQSSMDTSSNIENKVFTQTTSPRVADEEAHASQSGVQKTITTDEVLLTYEDEILATKEPSKAKVDDPLAELPLDMVSYEEKGASR
ncbi:MAG TPA: twin-arginine translocase TatA/TatE family subunit [Desulfosporosinus sp.]|nr:twin-arginine translocase TatA/TatE family subunit [Desulfosporosinus sp.]